MSEQAGFGSDRMWDAMGGVISRFSTAYVLYCNRVGFEDGLAFAGGSFIYGPSGELLAKAPDLDTLTLFQDINLEAVREARKKNTFKRDDKPEIILEALKRIVRRYED